MHSGVIGQKAEMGDGSRRRPPARRSAQAEVLDLRKHYGALLDLVGKWRDGYSELHVALLELSLLVGEPRRPAPSRGAPRSAVNKVRWPSEEDEEGDEDAALDAEPGHHGRRLLPAGDDAAGHGSEALLVSAGQPTSGSDARSRPRVAVSPAACVPDRGLRGAGNAPGGDSSGARTNGYADDSMSGDSDSSASFDIEVDEEWSRPLAEEAVKGTTTEADDDDDRYASIHLPFLSQVMDRIDEGSNEDDESLAGLPPSSGGSSGSRDSSVERLWANVQAAGHGAEAVPAAAGHADPEVA